MVKVTVNEGILEGAQLKSDLGKDFYSFKGIPYAQPPIGDLRFKAPQPPKPWQGVRSAKEHGPISPQHDLLYFNERITGSEDCLYLNVYSSNLKPTKPQAVMVFIHGGGYFCGSGNSDVYGPDFLIEHDVVLVTINYRLEVFGFLCLDSAEVPGNAGMKDQVAALRWVKNNIKNFGGDPENVTIFGESVGGASVTFHLASPMSKGLFKRAIVQSGTLLNQWASATYPKERAIKLAKTLGKETEDSKELLEFFQSQPSDVLIQARTPLTLLEVEQEATFFVNVYFGVVDEKDFGQERFFYGSVYDDISNGMHKDVEVVVGVTSEEGLISVGDVKKLTESLQKAAELSLEIYAPMFFVRKCKARDVFAIARKIQERYFKHGVDAHNLVRYNTLLSFVLPLWLWLKKYSKLCPKVYLYKFNCMSERNTLGIRHMEADYIEKNNAVCHCEELFYLFKNTVFNTPVNKNAPSYKMIDNSTKLWTNFAKYGNPTPDASLGGVWKPFNQSPEQYFNIDSSLEMKSGFEDDLKFWVDLYDEYCA